MQAVLLPVHRELLAGSRVALWADSDERLRLAELSILIGAGSAAALAVSCLDFSLGIPGHAILRAVLPMALGLSLAPRRLGGVVMGASAWGTISLLKFGGGPTPGIGAMTSLCLLGPLLDAALWRVRAGWPVYLGFALAGCLANLAAFGVRGAGKLSGFEALIGRPWSDWLGKAAWSYILCGVVAGLVSAAIWFRLRANRGSTPSREPAKEPAA